MDEKIINLIVSFLGEYSKQSNGWYSFNCPCCASETMGIADNKYNLEVKVDLKVRGCGGFHCWRCGETNNTKGTIVSLFKRYAPSDVFAEFKSYVKDYRQSLKYTLQFDDDINFDITDVEEIQLPRGFQTLDKSDKNAQQAFDYLYGRGLTDAIIERFHIGYIGNKSKDYSSRNRVYIPSYDNMDNLTYWVGRDYTGKNKQKMKNPLIPKTEVVFNEGLINYFEPITLVEGPFDHIVVPNSIPLLGKTLSHDDAVYSFLTQRAKCGVNIFLDDDARKDAVKIYKLLDNSELRGNVKIIPTPEGYDPSQLYQEYGHKGVLDVMCNAERMSETDFIW